MGVSKNNATPKSSHFNRVFHYKPSILEYHYSWKHPYRHYTHHITKTSRNCGWLLMRRFRCFQKIARKAQEFWPICVFDWVEDHEIWRHMDGGHTRGYVRKTVVVRSIATVGHLDGICIRQKRGLVYLGVGCVVLNVRDSPKVTSLAKFDGHLWRWSLILSFLFGVSWIRSSFGSLLYGFLWLFVEHVAESLVTLLWTSHGRCWISFEEWKAFCNPIVWPSFCSNCKWLKVTPPQNGISMNFRSRNTISNIFTLTIWYGFCFLVNTDWCCLYFKQLVVHLGFSNDNDDPRQLWLHHGCEISRGRWNQCGNPFCGISGVPGPAYVVEVSSMKSMWTCFGGFRQPADVHPTVMKLTHGLSEVDFAVIFHFEGCESWANKLVWVFSEYSTFLFLKRYTPRPLGGGWFYQPLDLWRICWKNRASYFGLYSQNLNLRTTHVS